MYTKLKIFFSIAVSLSLVKTMKSQSIDSFMVPKYWDAKVKRKATNFISGVDTFPTVVWDFSTIKISTDSSKITYKPINASLLALYPNARIHEEVVDNYNTSNFYSIKNNSLLNFGEYSNPQSYRTFNSGVVYLKFPFSLNSKFSQTTTFNQQLGSNNYNGTGYYYYTVPSKGKLKLANKTYDSVLLVVSRNYSNGYSEFLYVNYTWYKPGYSWWLAEYSEQYAKVSGNWMNVYSGLEFFPNPSRIPGYGSTNQFRKSNKKTIFPNPANSSIQILHITNNSNIKIIDNTGKTVISKNINSNETIDIKLLQNGIYTVQLTDKNGSVAFEKLVVSK